MTAVEDRPKAEIGSGAQAQGGPAPHHRSHQVDRQHPADRACSTWPWCAARSPTPRSPAIDTAAAKKSPGVLAVLTGAGRQGHPGRAAQRLADHARPEGRAASARSRSTGSRSPARSWRSSSPGPLRRPATPPSSSTSTTTSCPRPSTSRRPPRTRCSRTPTWGPTRARSGSSTRPAPGTGTSRRRRHRHGPGRRHPHRARVPPAAAHPRVHGAAVHRGRPDRRAADHLDRHPGAALRAHLHGGRPRHPRVQDPGHRPRRGRRLRRQAPVHARGGHHRPRRAAHRASRASTPRPAASRSSRPTTAATSGSGSPWPPPRTAPSPASRSTCIADMGAYLGLVDQRRADPRGVHVQRDLQVPGLPVQLHQRLHQHDVDRRLPRCRATRRRPSPSSG